VEGDDVGARLGKIRNDAINGFDHQVHVNWRAGMRTDGFANQRSDCQIGDVMVVHHIKMNDVGARSDDVADFLAQTGEVGGKQARSNTELGHGKLGNKGIGPILPESVHPVVLMR